MEGETSVDVALRDLLGTNLLDPEACHRIRQAMVVSGQRLVDVVLGLGLLPEDALAERLSAIFGLPRFPSATSDLGLDLSSAGSAFQEASGVAVLASDTGARCVVLTDPTDDEAMSALRFGLGPNVACHVTSPSELKAMLERLTNSVTDGSPVSEASSEIDLARLRDIASDAPTVKLVSDLIAEAFAAGASDIHLEPEERVLVVRFRVEGDLHEVRRLPIQQAPALLSRIKIVAGLDIGERRLPQDGAIATMVRGQSIDLRVATAPSVHGETAVLRLLRHGSHIRTLSELGFEPQILASIEEILRRPHGLFLVTGPTGSGKTTTLYAALQHLNNGVRKILTVEDPVEARIPGAVQIQVKPEIGLTFATALRSMLRHDPNVILIGEIRDPETAAIAVQAALTGHIVLASLHANSAKLAATRLQDLGVEEFLVRATLSGVLAQTLARQRRPSSESAALDKGVNVTVERSSTRIPVADILLLAE